MSYKLKHLSKFCCKPNSQLEFEAVKMAAEIGGFDLDEFEWPNLSRTYNYAWFDSQMEVVCWAKKDDETEIPVLDFCNKLRMTEEEAEKLEDDRVVFNMSGYCWSRDGKVLKIPKGYIAKVNEDGTEVTLHKK